MLRVRAWMLAYAVLTLVMMTALAFAICADWFWALARGRRYATRA